MKKTTKPIILLFFLSIYLLSGCSVRSAGQTEQPDETETAQTSDFTEESDMPYTFTAENTPDNLPGGGQICLIIENFDKDYMTNNALVYGKLKTLFGEPLYETEDNENLYSYCIRATSKDGDIVYLDVYSGPTGPAIGGDSRDDMNEKRKEAAAVLVEYIWQAEASDYECTSYYMDTFSKVTMGVKDGVPYCEETILNLSPEEADALFKRVWGLEE